MNTLWRQGISLCAALAVSSTGIAAATSNNYASSAVTTNQTIAAKATNQAESSQPGKRAGGSPVDLFRAMLDAEPDELDKLLADKPPEKREQLLAKLREYQALPPDERELRLRATELQWHVVQLLPLKGAERQARLQEVPQDIRRFVEDRLTQAEILPPPLQEELMHNAETLRKYLQIDTGNPAPQPPTEQVRKALRDTFKFFELTEHEQKEVLGMLSETERRQIERALESFRNLPPELRARCIRAFGRFATMTPEQREQFLKNAERWKSMTPAERQRWRELVRQVPMWPPEPPGLDQPPLPPLPPDFDLAQSTNAASATKD
ncbi:MAG: DUF3106 domain-containing protein [Verrucomicrobiae bacterium]|nr:DUF3106 domain-containing protein [Verrucomicrobiae bacterium]MDW7980891.1 DUF3106 domain-containing protein [Verrucomicrobiales bacterium]